MRISANGSSVYLDTIKLEDAPILKENANEKDIHIGVPIIPYPYKIEDAMAFIELATQKYISREEFSLGVHLQSKELIGMCSLHDIDSINKRAEIGYWIGKKYWGKGHAKDAIRLILGFGFGSLDLNKVYAKVLSHNERSSRLLSSLGFTKEGTSREEFLADGEYEDAFLFGLLKKEYGDEIKTDVIDYP